MDVSVPSSSHSELAEVEVQFEFVELASVEDGGGMSGLSDSSTANRIKNAVSDPSMVRYGCCPVANSTVVIPSE